jgi:hypothetical protein
MLDPNALAGEPRPTSARLAVLAALRRAALDTYGEERSAESSLGLALDVAATALWRIAQEPLEPLGPEPLPTHD